VSVANQFAKHRVFIAAILLLFALASGFLYGWAFEKNHVFPYGVIRSLVKHTEITSPDIASRSDIFAAFAKPVDVVMIGDSLTDNAEWHEIFPDIAIAGRGIAGDTSAGVRHRLDGILAMQPKKAFLMIGINDTHRDISIDDILKNYQNIAERLTKIGTKLYVQSVLYCQPHRAPAIFACAENLPVITALNKALQALAQQHGYEYVDLNRVLAPHGVLLDEYTWDGVHLNAAGYEVWAAEIKPLL
jgi:lysophospholipase L1-like esterase